MSTSDGLYSHTDRLRQVADQAMPAFAYGEPTFENYTESYAEQLAEFQLLFRPTTVLAMLDVIDAAEEALRADYVGAVSPVEMSAIAVKLARFRGVVG